MSFDTLGDLNYLAVLVAAVAYFVVGGIWYAPPVLGKVWMRASGVQPSGGQGAYLFMSFVAQLLGAAALAFLAAEVGASTVGDGVVLGLTASFGLVLTTLGLTQMFEKRPGALTYINVGYHVVGMVVASIIVAVWD